VKIKDRSTISAINMPADISGMKRDVSILSHECEAVARFA
jgi:hypothetical protein